MNWDNIKIMIAVNRYGSVAKAATQIGVNHSTLLRRLANLEKDLGLKLFNRLATGYEITADGEALLESALQMEKSMQDFQREASGQTHASSNRIVVSFPPLGSLELMPHIAEFRNENPDIELQIDFGTELKDLDKLEAEVILRYTNQPPEDYVGYEVLRFPTRLYASENYLQQHPKTRQAEDVMDWVLLEIPKLTDSLEQWILSNNPDARIAMRINAMEPAAKAVALGVGVSFITEHLAKPHKNLKALESEEHDIALWLMTHKDLRFTPRIKSFMDFMRQALPKSYPEYSRIRNDLKG